MQSTYYAGLYAGKSEYGAVLDARCVLSNNLTPADNQQERLCMTLSPSNLGNYLAGFADGEGSFNISFRKRKDYRSPWKVSACFNISQKEKPILELFQKHLGCGTLRSRPDGIWYYEVNTLEEIERNVIPFFETFPFLSQKKQRDFALFCSIVKILSAKQHLSQKGVENILHLRRVMNDGGKRKYSEREILNAYRESSETTRQTQELFLEKI